MLYIYFSSQFKNFVKRYFLTGGTPFWGGGRGGAGPSSYASGKVQVLRMLNNNGICFV